MESQSDSVFYKITARGRDFDKAVKMLKKAGGKFDGQTKLWSVPQKMHELIDEDLWGVESLGQAEVNAMQPKQAPASGVAEIINRNLVNDGFGAKRAVLGKITHQGKDYSVDYLDNGTVKEIFVAGQGKIAATDEAWDKLLAKLEKMGGTFTPS